MSFAESLADYTAAQIIAATGCPRGTAYDWKEGRREPPAWQQVHWLSIITAGAKKIKKHNKPSLATDTSREAGSRKRKS